VSAQPITLPDEFLQAVAERAAERAVELLAERQEAEAWLTVEGAAQHLAISASAVYEKCSRRDDFPVHREGSRSYFTRRELDEWRRGQTTTDGGSP
jgi:hypothetical protein